MNGPNLPAFSKIAGIYVHFFTFYLYYIGNVDISFIINWRLFANISCYMYLYYQYQTFCWITGQDNKNSQNKTIQGQILEMEMLAKHMLHANIGNANSLISITKYDQRITRYGRSIYHKPTSFKKRRSSAGTYTEIPHHLYLASTTHFTRGLKMVTYSSLFSSEYTRSAIYDTIA